MSGDNRIIHLSLDEAALGALDDNLDYERRIAIADLIADNRFVPADCPAGPYRVALTRIGDRLIFDVCDEADTLLRRIELPVIPFRRYVRDYLMLCESYYDAIRTAAPERVEAMDEARRALHLEGAELLRARLENAADIDIHTARRLFTLISVLRMRREGRA